ncbi:hypothetical protein [Kribbella sp. NPDC051620]|uniref:hypothetical protein n=1 Tax=Kribbella sp. NPDC051620 TaxID=3364120 RepID=UPI00379D2901
MTTEALETSVRRLLHDTQLRSISRTLDMGEFHATGPTGDIAIHIQCPFRLVRGTSIVLGSADLNSSREGATFYDDRATQITELLAKSTVPMTDVTVGNAGALAISWRDDLRLEVLPTSSAVDTEAWRIFRRNSGPHLGYPEHVI